MYRACERNEQACGRARAICSAGGALNVGSAPPCGRRRKCSEEYSMKRPVGVTIVAVLLILYGIFSLLLALLGLLGSALLASGVGNVKYSAGTLAYATITDAVLGILYLAFGIGAFSLK